MFYVKICNKLLCATINILSIAIIFIINIMFIVDSKVYIMSEKFELYGSEVPDNLYNLLGIVLTTLIASGLMIMLTNYYKGNLELLDLVYSKGRKKNFLFNILGTYIGVYSLFFIITFINGYFQYSKIINYRVDLFKIINNIFIPYILIIILSIFIVSTFKKLHISMMIFIFYYFILEYFLPKFLQIPGHILDYMITGEETNFRYTYLVLVMIMILIYKILNQKIKLNNYNSR